MQKKIIISVFGLVYSVAVVAQVTFQPFSFDQALTEAKKKGKFVMVQLDSRECDHCNEVATKGFSDKRIDQKIFEDYISIRPLVETEDWLRLTQEYDAPAGLITLFFSPNGILLHRHNGSTSRGQPYADAAALALANQEEITNVESLTQAFSQDRNNLNLLYTLLQKRMALRMSTDSLIDYYISILPADSLKSIDQLQFIMGFAPVLGTRADSMIRKDFGLFNKAWHRLSLQNRLRINNSIIYKTRKKAISQRNELLANRVASFAASTHTNNYQRGQRASTENMMEFYKGTNDTSRYLSNAVLYYDTYLMKIPVDSILRIDSLNLKRLLDSAKGDTVKVENGYRVNKTIPYRPVAQFYMQDLNKGAWNFYKMTNDHNYLQKAVAWSERANEFFQSPESIDTYARLLYKAGDKASAIQLQEKAIALKKKRGFNSKELEEVLSKMKQTLPKID